MSNQLLFFFSALGAFNGTLLSIYFLFFARPRHRSNYYLGALLLAISIRVWKSVFYFFNADLSKIYLQIGLSACFLIGPLLILYVKASKEERHSQAILLLHVVLIIAIGYSYPYSEFPDLWNGIFYKIIYYQWLIFILISALSLLPSIKKAISHHTLAYRQSLSLNILGAVSVIWIGYFAAAYTSYIVGALTFSCMLYLMIIVILKQRKTYFTTSLRKKKYADKIIDKADIHTITEKLRQALTEQCMYRDPNLTLPQLAKALHVTPHKLSQFINQVYDTNFTHYINTYRIEASKRILKDNQNYTMEALAEECGFNSKSTFYNAFKKLTDTTPARYAQMHQKMSKSID